MIYHPPTLFLGYAAYTVPFALTTASLLATGSDAGPGSGRWLRGMRPWSLLAWLALGLGILMGAQWSYVELGWGGYWAWDPVENASLIPWLIGTGLVHCLRLGKQREAMLLAILTFVLCLFAAFVTRGGIVLSELHGFAQRAAPITYWLVGLMSLALAGPLWLLSHRWRGLRSRPQMRNGWSRLALWLMCGLAGAVLLGTVLPTLVRWFLGRQIALERGYYDRTFGPLAAMLLLTLGACALSRRRQGVVLQLRRGRSPRRRCLGAALVHLSLFLMALAIVGEGFFKTQQRAVLRPGERATVGHYTLTYEGLNRQISPAAYRLQAALRVERGGRVSVLRPENSFYRDVEQWVTEVAIGPGLDEDVYVVLLGLSEDDKASFQILINPLMSWLWIGGALMLLGTVAALWPGRPLMATSSGPGII
jgi:cytochrome c-type biogenesis protein CcmF